MGKGIPYMKDARFQAPAYIQHRRVGQAFETCVEKKRQTGLYLKVRTMKPVLLALGGAVTILPFVTGNVLPCLLKEADDVPLSTIEDY